MLEAGVEGDDQAAIGLPQDVRPHHRRKRAGGRPRSGELSHEQGGASALEFHHRECPVLLECGVGPSVGLGQGHPELQAPEAPSILGRRLFGVGNAPPRRHQVQHPGARRSSEPQAVVVNDLTVEQPGDGLQADVRMRGHVHGLARREGEGTKGVEEAPGPHEAPLAPGKQTPDGQAQKIAEPARQRFKDRGGGRLAGSRFGGGRLAEVAHRASARNLWRFTLAMSRTCAHAPGRFMGLLPPHSTHSLDSSWPTK